MRIYMFENRKIKILNFQVLIALIKKLFFGKKGKLHKNMDTLSTNQRRNQRRAYSKQNKRKIDKNQKKVRNMTEYCLKTTTDRAGNVYIRDLNSGRYIDMIKQRDGTYLISGDRELFQVVGGRGEAGELLKRAEDGVFTDL